MKKLNYILLKLTCTQCYFCSLVKAKVDQNQFGSKWMRSAELLRLQMSSSPIKDIMFGRSRTSSYGCHLCVLLIYLDNIKESLDSILTQICNEHVFVLQIFSMNIGQIFFSKIFGGHESFLWGHWYPCFGLLVMSPLGFKARVGSLICTWWRCTCFPEIHLWFDTCQPLGGQHGSQADFFHIPATRHWWAFNGRPIAP